MEVAREALERLGQRLAEIPGRIERLKKAGVQKLSRTDEDSRFLRERKGFALGYTATIAVSEDHLIVAQQVSQASTDNGLLVPMVEAVERECGERPGQALADSGFFSQENLEEMERRRCGTASGTATHEMQAALTGGTRGLSAKKRDRGTGTGSSEGAARDAAISVARAGESGGGVHTGRDGVEPHANLARRSPVAPPRLSHQRGPAVVAPIAGYEKLVVTATNQ